MKKFYTLMSVVLSGFLTATAITPGRRLPGGDIKLLAQTSALKSKPVLRAIEVKDTPITDVCGNYTWSYTSALDGKDYSVEIKIATGQAENDIVIDGMLPGLDCKVCGTYDGKSGEITLPKQKVTTYDGEDIYFFKEIVIVDSEGYIEDFEVSQDPLVLTYAGESIKMEILESISIGTGAQDGYFVATVLNKFIRSWEEDPSMGYEWKNVGKATFCDGWQYPGYEFESQFDHPWKVDVEKCIGAEGIYRLVDPYLADGSPLAEYSLGGKPGYIIFNIADTEFPFIYPEHFAFADDYGQYYQYDVNGFLHIIQGKSKDEVLKSGRTDLSKFKDGVFTIGLSLFGNSTGDRNAAESWYEADDSVDPKSSIDMTEILNQSGVDDVDIDNSAAPQYYNLQGIRINNPGSGQVVIKVVDGRSSKVKF